MRIQIADILDGAITNYFNALQGQGLHAKKSPMSESRHFENGYLYQKDKDSQVHLYTNNGKVYNITWSVLNNGTLEYEYFGGYDCIDLIHMINDNRKP